MVGKSPHLQVISQKRTQNAANLPLQACNKNQWTFLLYDTSVGFNSCNTFANLGSTAKFFAPWANQQQLIPAIKSC